MCSLASVLPSASLPYDDLRDLLYGTAGDGAAVFVPAGEAQRLARWWDILTTAATWGEVYERDRDLYAEFLLRGTVDDVEDALRLALEQRRVGGRTATALPPDEEPFRMNDHVDLGLWPPFPYRLMMEWVPEDLQDAYGEVHEDTWGARWLHVPGERLDALRADLEARGYRCRPNQAAMNRTFGDASNN